MCLHILTHIVLISALALMTPVAPPTAFACRTMSIFCLPKFISQPASNAHICGIDCQQSRNYPAQQQEMEVNGLMGWWAGGLVRQHGDQPSF